MKRLGYTRYVAQGGDQGASVTDAMARLVPDGLLGTEVDKGGHFAAWEEPELFAEEMRAAFRSFRNGGSS
jgi:pimeloyl-ACP methyl ester carboxylesterase